MPYVECLALAIKQHVCHSALASVASLSMLLGCQHTESDDRERRAGTVSAISEPAHDWRV